MIIQCSLIPWKTWSILLHIHTPAYCTSGLWALQTHYQEHNSMRKREQQLLFPWGVAVPLKYDCHTKKSRSLGAMLHQYWQCWFKNKKPPTKKKNNKNHTTQKKHKEEKKRKKICLLQHFLCHNYTTRSFQTIPSVQDQVNRLAQQPVEEATC